MNSVSGERTLMRRKGMNTASAWFVRLACTIALVLVAFAHRPVDVVAADAAAIAKAERMAYMLPDGTLPDLCGVMADEDGKSGHAVIPCEFCRVASAVALPLPAEIVLADRVRAPEFSPRGEDRSAAPARLFVPAAPPQGPPSLSA